VQNGPVLEWVDLFPDSRDQGWPGVQEKGHIGPQLAGDLRRQIDQLLDNSALEREKQLIEQLNVSLYSIDDEAYPKLLRLIHDPPPLLYVRGKLLPQDTVALAIVGARRCTHYGREQAKRMSSLCSDAGLSIISSGDYGIAWLLTRLVGTARS